MSSKKSQEQSFYDKVFESAKPKEKLFLKLLQDGVTPKRIVEIKADDVTEKGVMVDGQEIELDIPTLTRYINDNMKIIDARNSLFPGKLTQNMSPQNILIVLGKLCRKNGGLIPDLELKQLEKEPKKPKVDVPITDWILNRKKLQA